MIPAEVAFLCSEPGRALLDAARATRDVPAHQRPGRLAEAASDSPLDHGRAVRLVLAQDALRLRAASKVPFAEALLLHPEALEQATAWEVAAERATRWPGPPDALLTDLTAGLGLDALAAARRGRPVRAYEHDSVRAALLRANAAALGLTAALEVVETDVRDAAPAGKLAFLDPGRRPRGQRTREAGHFEPPEPLWPELLGRFEAGMLKLPPGSPPESVAAHPFEVVSLAGRARETRVFVGAWDALPARRALVLRPGVETAAIEGAAIEGIGRPWPAAVSVERGMWLLDPDVSVVLAGLVGDLAHDVGLAPVHPRIAYLTGPARAGTRVGTWLEVEAVLPAKPAPLNAWLAAQEVGRLTIRTRGTKDPVETWRKRLRPRGKRAGTLVITRRQDDRWVAYGCLAPGK